MYYMTSEIHYNFSSDIIYKRGINMLIERGHNCDYKVFDGSY